MLRKDSRPGAHSGSAQISGGSESPEILNGTAHDTAATPFGPHPKASWASPFSKSGFIHLIGLETTYYTLRIPCSLRL